MFDGEIVKKKISFEKNFGLKKFLLKKSKTKSKTESKTESKTKSKTESKTKSKAKLDLENFHQKLSFLQKAFKCHV